MAPPQREMGPVKVTLTPAEGVSRFPLSSTARDLIVTGPMDLRVKV
jgi:hypothetical protein